jgi:hypothetical protein
MIQDVKSIFVAKINQKNYIQNNYCPYRNDNWPEGLYCQHYYPMEIHTFTGKYEILLETDLSRVGLNIGDKFYINEEQIVTIEDKIFDSSEHITYITDIIKTIENEKQYEKIQNLCNELNLKEDEKIENFIKEYSLTKDKNNDRKRHRKRDK